MPVSAVQQSDSVIHTYAFFFHILFHYGLSHDIEYSSLCYTVGPCCLSTLNVTVCIYQPQTPSPSLSPPPLGNHKSVLYVYESPQSIFKSKLLWSEALYSQSSAPLKSFAFSTTETRGKHSPWTTSLP